MDNYKSTLRDSFAKNVYKYRKQANMSQEALAEKLDVAPNTIWKIENSKEIPKIEKIEKLAELLNIAPYELFLRKEDEAYSKSQILSIEQDVHSLLSTRINDLFNSSSPDSDLNYNMVKRPLQST